MARQATMYSTLKRCLFILVCFLIVSPTAFTAQETICPFQHIYQFGDSISDTGNIILKGGLASVSPSSRLPYGMTSFHRPTGRCSNGLLMIDFISRALNLPLLDPYLKRTGVFNQGVDFAVAGSTALDTSFFQARNIPVPISNTPLSAQMQWFKDHLKSVCRSPSDCAARLQRSLIMMGEIGGNDYNHAFFNGKSIQEVRTYVRHVVSAIINGVREVVRLGAVRVVVPGNFPIGCIPIYLTSFANPDPEAYDQMGCLREVNEFARYHNNYLQRALHSLRQKLKRDNPNVVVVYADYYGALESVLARAPFLGFDRGSLLKSCCGIGGIYNYDGRRMCGTPGVPVCREPEKYIHWDGIHMTQKAYRHMSEFLISDMLSKMQCVW
ncbi:GDSL esterase/lipase At5g03980-like [Coffea eugenioides]|uniref:GDSL esterase/lipase At5g03980-like n=1 Tax=Coffea eugenioides TaxID=49369 RepID=UPI000F60D504|nr:GDSL esterase/lipase At5g03980-like [Coffea eugenioides]